VRQDRSRPRTPRDGVSITSRRHRGGPDDSGTAARGVHIAYGFFAGRRQVEIDRDVWDDGATLATCPNVPRTIHAVISGEKATLQELGTVYGLEDLYDMLEIIIVDAHNHKILSKRSGKK
jgi:hypothetical protein